MSSCSVCRLSASSPAVAAALLSRFRAGETPHKIAAWLESVLGDAGPARATVYRCLFGDKHAPPHTSREDRDEHERARRRSGRINLYGAAGTLAGQARQRPRGASAFAAQVAEALLRSAVFGPWLQELAAERSGMVVEPPSVPAADPLAAGRWRGWTQR